MPRTLNDLRFSRKVRNVVRLRRDPRDRVGAQAAAPSGVAAGARRRDGQQDQQMSTIKASMARIIAPHLIRATRSDYTIVRGT